MEQCNECHVDECKIEKQIDEINEEHLTNGENGIDETKPITDTARNSESRDFEMEKQLEIVQKQLEELSQLPSTIQATIEEVKKQIAGLIHFRNLDIQSNNNAVTSTSVQLTEVPSASIDQELKKENEQNSNEENQQISTNGNKSDSKNGIESDLKVENGHEPKNETDNGVNGTITEHVEEISIQKESFESETVASCTSDTTEIIASRADEQIAKLKLEQCFNEQQEIWFNEKKQV